MPEEPSPLGGSEARFRAMADASPVGIFLSDPSGANVYTNPALLRMVGLTFEEALGGAWQTAIHPEDRDHAIACRSGRKETRMKHELRLGVLLSALGCAACGGKDAATGPTQQPTTPPTLGFFVSSSKSTTGNLGGLRGADARCQSLAAAVGAGSRTWRAYLSVERDPDNGNAPTDARSRIGTGPWLNAHGVAVARNLDELHARTGDTNVFVDERGQQVPGQWPGSPSPNEHDILTGSTSDGRVSPGLTCSDWTSASTSLAAQVGHADGLGPGGSAAGALSSWNSSHTSQNCADTAPRGGAGRIYCFARN